MKKIVIGILISTLIIISGVIVAVQSGYLITPGSLKVIKPTGNTEELDGFLEKEK
jgi:hypothetical protein